MNVHAQKRGAEIREALDRKAAGDVSPLALAVYRALRDRPAWRRESPSWIAVSVWAYGYADGKPTPAAVAGALDELRRPA
jgi:hypothetical protein